MTSFADDDLVVLDLDGTLVDSTYHHAVAWDRAFARHDVVVPHWRLHRTVGMGGDRFVTEILGDEAEERQGDALREAWTAEFRELLPEVHPLPGAADLVRRLKDLGARVALASSGEEEFVEAALADLGIADLLDLVVSTADVGSSKPAPDLVSAAVDRAGATRAVMVGDTVWDVEAAARAGVSCVAVRTGGFGEAELQQAGAALVVDGPEDLLGLTGEDWQGLLRPQD